MLKSLENLIYFHALSLENYHGWVTTLKKKKNIVDLMRSLKFVDYFVMFYYGSFP